MELCRLPARLKRALQLRWRQWRAIRCAFDVTEAKLSVPIRRVLVICYGNIYRSPFVANLLKSASPALEVRSAGFHDREGRESPSQHVLMSAALGVDLGEHRSRLVTSQDLDWADAIVLMDRQNWSGLRKLGAREDKFIWLGALERGASPEIPDPYGRSQRETERILQRMYFLTKELGRRITVSISP